MLAALALMQIKDLILRLFYSFLATSEMLLARKMRSPDSNTERYPPGIASEKLPEGSPCLSTDSASMFSAVKLS
jgi:hypothetical protein